MKILVIASEPISAEALRRAVGSEAADDAEVLVIAPALHDSALRFWLSDADAAIRQAQWVANSSVEQLTGAGILAQGDTGESEPLSAVKDSLEGFPADRILIFTHPEGDRAYHESISAPALQERFGVPAQQFEIEH